MAISALGLGSGIDIRSIVDGLVAAEREPQEFLLTRQETNLQAKISAFGTFKSAVSDFRASLSGLRQQSQFQTLQATSSHPDSISISASSNADVGQFSAESKQLAKAQSLASAGFADANAVVGSGTLTIRFGTSTFDANTGAMTDFSQNGAKGTLTLNLDSSNNTLTGLRDAINDADAGVNATIVNDGTAFRLVLTSSETGAQNSMEINADDPSLAGLEFNTGNQALSQTQSAQNAILSINGLDISNSTNTFDQAIKGLSITLNKADVGVPVQLGVARNSSGATSALETFVEKFNELNDTVKSLTAFNPATGTASTLLGDPTVRSGVNQIRSTLSQVVPGLANARFRTLADLGLRTQADGGLSFDTSKFNAAMAEDADNVAAIFSSLGRPDNSAVTFLDATDNTRPGRNAVNVTQAATQGSLDSGNGSVSALTVTAGVNDRFKIRVDGVLSGDITLAAGTFGSGEELAAAVQAGVNGDSNLKNAGATVSVSFDSANNSLKFTSSKIGSQSTVAITESTAADLGLAVATGVSGTHVAGTINGLPATGDGQTLTASNGLKLLIEPGQSGNLGNVTFSQGLLQGLNNVLDGLLGSNGSITARTDGLQKSLEEIDERRTQLAQRVNQFENRILSQFNAMDALIGQFQATGAFLTQQLASLPQPNSGGSNN
ncbi:MAG: flagellar filament capping protein FliD [Methylococcales bacterium]|nr:flagellar filament capping protein FliD [Methylococcales bacterium]